MLGASLALLALLSGLGLWLGILHIRAIAQRQIALDRCAGASALRLRLLLQAEESSTMRLRRAKEALLPRLQGKERKEALALFREGAAAERALQREIQKQWKEEESRWNTLPGLGCGLRNAPKRSMFPAWDFALADPRISHARLMQSDFSPLPEQSFRLSASVARISTEALIEKGTRHDWTVRWSK